VGNREELLKGARECLFEKGYVQTRARDISNASGVGLAAIGYHFGTKEALLQEAMVEANQEWGQRLASAGDSVKMPEGASWPAWFEDVWGRIITASEQDKRMLMASLEVLLNVDQSSSICSRINDGMACASDTLVSMFGHDTDDMTPEEARAVGSLYFALEIGVRLLHAATPDRAPSPAAITLAMKIIGQKFCDERTGSDPSSAD
jgi:AcrR family transcriptional regulator